MLDKITAATKKNNSFRGDTSIQVYLLRNGKPIDFIFNLYPQFYKSVAGKTQRIYVNDRFAHNSPTIADAKAFAIKVFKNRK